MVVRDSTVMISRHTTMSYYCCKNSDQYDYDCALQVSWSHCKISGHVIKPTHMINGHNHKAL